MASGLDRWKSVVVLSLVRLDNIKLGTRVSISNSLHWHCLLSDGLRRRVIVQALGSSFAYNCFCFRKHSCCPCCSLVGKIGGKCRSVSWLDMFFGWQLRVEAANRRRHDELDEIGELGSGYVLGESRYTRISIAPTSCVYVLMVVSVACCF